MNINLVLHPQENIKDFFLHVSLVRFLHEQNEGKTIYFICEKYHKHIQCQFSDLENFDFEILEQMDQKTILKALLGKFQNVKTRFFFGEFDKYRLDAQKNLYVNDGNMIDVYKSYGYDKHDILSKHFKVVRNVQNESRILANIKNVANLDFSILSSEHLPIEMRKSSSICLILNKMFSNSNFFESICIIERCKHIFLSDRDEFSLYVYLLYTNDIIKGKNVTFMQTTSPIFDFKYLPVKWKIVNEEDFLKK